MKQSWASGLFGIALAGLFWLFFWLTGNMWVSIGISTGVGIGINVALYALGKRKL